MKKTNLIITEFLGDGIGPELRQAVHSVASVLPLKVTWDPVDLSFDNRQKVGGKIYDQAMTSIEKTRLAFKYPTVTKGESPNAKLRNLCHFSVIHRPVVSIPGIRSNFKEGIDLDIMRVATGGTYEHGGEMVSRDVAVSLRIVERGPCQSASEYAFSYGRKHKKTVTSSSKYTIQRVTDGLFEEVVKDVAKRYPDVSHQVELFDALLAKIILKPARYQVIVCLNEYGDFLSDMACGLAGSMGIGASASIAFDTKNQPTMAMFDPAGGTAPDIAGKNIVNPSAALIAFSMLLTHVGHHDLGNALNLAIRSLIAEHKCTSDLGGKLSTTGFTAKVIEKFSEEI